MATQAAPRYSINPELEAYYSGNMGFYMIKLRKISAYEHSMILDGLKAMDYEVQWREDLNNSSLFCEGTSVAALKISSNPKGLDLSLPLFSSNADWELMRDWLLNFFNFYSGIAIAENELIDDIESFFSEEKLKEQQAFYSHMLHEAMQNDEEIVHNGAYRPFFAGKKIYERLREFPEEEHLRMFQEMIIQSQYTNLHSAESVKGRFNDDLNSTYTIIDNSSDIILQPADLIKIHPGNEEDEFFISYGSIDKLLRHGWHYLDEKQVFIPKMSPDEWKSFCEQARENSINTDLFSKYIQNEERE
jgi:hypothetical protein